MVWLVFWSKILFEVDFSCHSPGFKQNEGELNKNNKNKNNIKIKIKIKIEKLKVKS